MRSSPTSARFPMVVNYKVMYEYAIDRSLGQFKAPFNVISNKARESSPPRTRRSSRRTATRPIRWPSSTCAPSRSCSACRRSRRRAITTCSSSTCIPTITATWAVTNTTGNGAGCYMVAGPRLDRRAAAGRGHDVPQRDRVQPRHLPHAALQSRRHGEREEGAGGLQGSGAFGLPRQAGAAAGARGSSGRSSSRTLPRRRTSAST